MYATHIIYFKIIFHFNIPCFTRIFLFYYVFSSVIHKFKLEEGLMNRN